MLTIYKAAIWFPSDEVSTATSFGVFGNQLGVALGFVIPPLIVKGPIDAFNDNGAFPIDWSNTTLYPEEAEQGKIHYFLYRLIISCLIFNLFRFLGIFRLYQKYSI